MSKHWDYHPAIRTGDALTAGERAADFLKRWFGSWLFLGILNGLFFTWITIDVVTGQRIDPGLFYANLFLSWLAGQQGGALQIASNRGDRINAELARHDFDTNTKSLAKIEENTAITQQSAVHIERILAHLGLTGGDK